MKKLNLVVLQARMSSTRLPGKVMSQINGHPMIYWEISRISKAKLVNKIVVAISDQSSDDILADYLDSIHQEYKEYKEHKMSVYILVGLLIIVWIILVVLWNSD